MSKLQIRTLALGSIHISPYYILHLHVWGMLKLELQFSD